MRFDVFLSYASADRSAIIEPLLKKLDERGIQSWCDVHEINWGDSIIERIQEGLSGSRFVIAFLSRAYLKRDWTMKELRSAMAQQISGRTIVLPVLLGVSDDDLHGKLPFLAEIRHLSIYEYNEKRVVKDYQLARLVAELERVQAQARPIKVTRSFEVIQLEDAILSVSYNRHYGFYSILTHRQYAEVRRRRFSGDSNESARSDIRSAIRAFIEKGGFPEESDFEVCWLDIDESNSPTYVLQSGNVIRPHRARALCGEVEDDDYLRTGAPPAPSCVTEGPRGEILFGYPDGSIVLWDGQLHQLGAHSARVTCVDRSTESIFASGDAEGHVAIWSRQSRVLRRMVKALPAAISSISVSRMAGSALIAASDVDGNIGICTFDGDDLRKFPCRDGAVTQLAFVAGGAPLLACARGTRIEIWDYAKGEIVAVCDDYDAPITSMHIASGSRFEHAFFDDMNVRDSPIRIALVTAGFADGHVHGWHVEA